MNDSKIPHFFSQEIEAMESLDAETMGELMFKALYWKRYAMEQQARAVEWEIACEKLIEELDVRQKIQEDDKALEEERLRYAQLLDKYQTLTLGLKDLAKKHDDTIDVTPVA